MTNARWPRWLCSPWFGVPATAAWLLVLATLVPIVPWQARCYDEPVAGPYRPIFLAQVMAWLSLTDVYYWRFGDRILLRALPVFDGEYFFDRAGVLLYIAKISDRLQENVTIDGVLYPKPPAVKRVEEESKTKGGIIIPDTAKEKPQEGEVVSVGPGARDDSGKVNALELKAGDRILFGKWSGTEVKIDGEDLIIMKESDVLGVLS